MKAFEFDRLTRALLEMKHDPETVDNLEALVTARMAHAWQEGHDSCGQSHSCFNPYEEVAS